jgi:prepilin-type N-terminal cleavage/methylation domain-containing protein
MMRSRGFTLIEMLVAIGLMALMALVCWRGLEYLTHQRALIDEEGTELARILRAFAQIEHDVTNRLPDIAAPARATQPELPLALSVLPSSDSAQLEIYRTAAMLTKAERIVYRRAATGLVRQASGTEALVLPGVSRLRIRIQAAGFWVEPGYEQTVRPVARATAIEIAVEDGKGGLYVKVVPL